MSHDSNLVELFKEIAPAIGATLKIEPRYRRSGMLEFGNGSVLFFRNNHLNINTAGNARMARDKSFLSHFLAATGFSTLPEVTVSRYDLDHGSIAPSKLGDILRFAAGNGWRTIVKPNARTQGRGVRLTTDRRELLDAISDTLAIDGVCIVQQPCAMPEYRLVVLKGKVIQAYGRKPMTIAGDGSSTVEALLERKLHTISASRNENDSPELLSVATRLLKSAGRQMNDVAPAGEQIPVAETANLSAGGEATDALQQLHPRWRKLAVDLAARCGLLLCGIDIFIDDVGGGVGEYRVIEVNSAPGLDDYLFQGDAQKARVLALYREVLETAALAMSFVATNQQGSR
jgi:D-alanine-D-alanine ligase-like ATP-grasp enzyme